MIVERVKKNEKMNSYREAQIEDLQEMTKMKKKAGSQGKTNHKDGNVVDALRMKLENRFQLNEDADIDTLVSNALNTYTQMAQLSAEGFSIFIGKPGAAELRQMRFLFEDIDEIEEPSVKIKLG